MVSRRSPIARTSTARFFFRRALPTNRTTGPSGRESRRLASALERRGIGQGDTVAIMAPNVPEMLEAHYGVPMAGAVLNALNYRLDADNIRFIMNHAHTKLLITDREFSETIEKALDGVDEREIREYFEQAGLREKFDEIKRSI